MDMPDATNCNHDNAAGSIAEDGEGVGSSDLDSNDNNVSGSINMDTGKPMELVSECVESGLKQERATDADSGEAANNEGEGAPESSLRKDEELLRRQPARRHTNLITERYFATKWMVDYAFEHGSKTINLELSNNFHLPSQDRASLLYERRAVG